MFIVYTNVSEIFLAIFIATTFGNQALNAMVKTNLSMKQFFNYKTQEELIMDIQDCKLPIFAEVKKYLDVRQNDKYRELLDQRRANQNLLQAHYGWTTTKVSEDDNLSFVEKLNAKKQKFQENSLEMGKIKAAYESLSGKDFESAGREYLQHIYPYYIHEEKEDASSDGIYDKMIENERNIWMEEINRNKSSYQVIKPFWLVIKCCNRRWTLNYSMMESIRVKMLILQLIRLKKILNIFINQEKKRLI